MSKTQEVIKYYLDTIDTLFYAKTDDWFEPLADFVGTGICDGYCHKDSSDCVDYCALFHAMSTLKTEPTIENLDKVKSIVSQMIKDKF